MQMAATAVARVGPVLVAVVAWRVLRRQSTDSRLHRADQQRVFAEQRDAAVQAAIDHVLAHNRQALVAERELAGKDLDGKKSLIDQQLATMTAKLDEVSTMAQNVEAERARSFSDLNAQLSQQHEVIPPLLHTTPTPPDDPSHT